MDRIAAKVREQDPDVVLLQEVWFGRYKRRLKRDLAPDYQAIYQPRCVSRWPRGGLVVFLRRASGWIADEPVFFAYDQTAPWYRLSEGDGISGKGVLTVELRRGAQRLTVVNTHIQSQYRGHPYVAERRAQIEQLASALDARDPDLPALIAGDFNTDAKEELYASRLAKLGTDLTEAERSDCQCGTSFDDTGRRAKWIDYLLTRNFNAQVTVQRVQNDGPDQPYSDHDALLVRLTYGQPATNTIEEKR